MRDEFAGKAYLHAVEVRKLLRLTSRKDFAAFLAENPLFPKQVAVGKTRNGKPRLLFPKGKVLAFLELLEG